MIDYICFVFQRLYVIISEFFLSLFDKIFYDIIFDLFVGINSRVSVTGRFDNMITVFGFDDVTNLPGRLLTPGEKAKVATLGRRRTVRISFCQFGEIGPVFNLLEQLLGLCPG